MTYSAENFSPAFKFWIATDLRRSATALLADTIQQRRIDRTARILSALSDTTLHDIGLDRDDILWAARHAATAAEHRARP